MKFATIIILLTFLLKTLHNTLKAHYLLIWNTFWINRSQNIIVQPIKGIAACPLWAAGQVKGVSWLASWVLIHSQRLSEEEQQSCWDLFWLPSEVGPAGMSSIAILQQLYYILWAKYYN